MYHNIVILNGPNLNLIGKREVEIYGRVSMLDYYQKIKSTFPTLNIAYEQSNHEGDLIDWIQEYGYNSWGIILNAGGYTHTSISIRDAVSAIPEKVVELHISNIYEREDFRKHSYLADVCDHHVIGKGIEGYEFAVRWLAGL